MCRYAFSKYKSTFGCFHCQVGFKRRNLFEVDSDAKVAHDAKCPNCGNVMANLGRDLRLPEKDKDEQWACIKYLVDNKYNIYSCGCQGIGFVPHKIEDAIELVKNVAVNRKKYVYEEALKEKKTKLEADRKRKKDALRTKLLQREVKYETKGLIKNKIALEFISFQITNKRKSETLLHNFSASKHFKIPFTFEETDADTKIKIDVRQLIASEVLELQEIFKNET